VASGACVKAKSQNGSKASTTASGDPMESDLEQFRMLTRGGSRVCKRTLEHMVWRKAFPAFKVGNQ
jgi:hypothetical protein